MRDTPRLALATTVTCLTAALCVALFGTQEPVTDVAIPIALCALGAVMTAILGWIASFCSMQGRGRWGVTALLLVIVCVLAWRATLREWRETGFPPARGAWVSLGCAVVVALAVILMAVPRRAGAGDAPWRAGRPVLVGVLVTALATGIVWAANPAIRDLRVVSTQASDSQRAARPSSVHHVAWRRTLGAGDSWSATADGLVVASGDTLTGLDGATGTTRWTYRRPGADIISLSVSPSGATVSITEHPDSGAWRVLLDARGRVLHQGWEPYANPSVQWALLDDFTVTTTSSGWTARDLSGHALWQRTPASGCTVVTDNQSVPEPLARTAHTVVLAETCDDTVHLTQMGRSTTPLATAAPEHWDEPIEVATAPDGSRTLLQLSVTHGAPESMDDRGGLATVPSQWDVDGVGITDALGYDGELIADRRNSVEPHLLSRDDASLGRLVVRANGCSPVPGGAACSDEDTVQLARPGAALRFLTNLPHGPLYRLTAVPGAWIAEEESWTSSHTVVGLA